MTVTTELEEVRTHEAPAVPATLPLSDPTPLGFAAVGLPFCVVSLTFTGVLSADVGVVALPLALVYGTIGLAIAGIVSFKNRDIFGAFTYSSFACFFLSYAAIPILLTTKVTSFQAGGQGQAFGTFLLGWDVIVGYLLILSFRFPRVFSAVLVAVWTSLIVLAAGFFATSPATLKLGGWLGLIGGALSLYVSAAVLTNTLVGRPVLRL